MTFMLLSSQIHITDAIKQLGQVGRCELGFTHSHKYNEQHLKGLCQIVHCSLVCLCRFVHM